MLGTTLEYHDGDQWIVLENSNVVNYRIPRASLVVKKVSEDQYPLDGAVFELLKENQSGVYESMANTQMTTGTDGKIQFADILPGNYLIKETNAPLGFYMLNMEIPFTVDDAGVLTITGESADWSFADGELIVINHSGSELPATGGVGTLPFAIGGLLLMAASCLYGFNRRNRRRCVR